MKEYGCFNTHWHPSFERPLLPKFSIGVLIENYGPMDVGFFKLFPFLHKLINSKAGLEAPLDMGSPFFSALPCNGFRKLLDFINI